jgi:hypothetical protein
MDGDMVDGATIFQSDYFPTLVSGYNHIGYTLNQGQITAYVNSPGAPSITPEFDPTVTLSWSINFDNVGFGSDAGNALSVDNIQIESVPEPGTIAMLVGTMYGAAFFKQRRSSFRRGLCGSALC